MVQKRSAWISGARHREAVTMSTAGAKPATATKLSSVALGKVRLSQVEFSKGGQ